LDTAFKLKIITDFTKLTREEYAAMVNRQCLQLLCLLILLGGIVKADFFQSSSRSGAKTSNNNFPVQYHLVGRGGAQSSDDDDDYDSDPGPPSRDNHRPERRRERRPPTPPPPPKSAFTSLAEKSYALTTHALSATAIQSGKAAYYLIRPKKVEVKELFGLWRMDQSLIIYEDEEPETSSATIEVTPGGTVIVPPNGNGDGGSDESRYTFTPAYLASTAKLEWRREDGQEQQYFYKAYIHRKVADASVIKLKGKIYRVDHTGWRGKNEKLVPVGTFVARRRLRLLPEDDDEDDEDEEENMEEEEEDWGDQSDDGYDVGDDMLAEEEYDDQDEDY
jgi:hypothetical protein